MSFRSTIRAIFLSICTWLLTFIASGIAAKPDPMDWPNWRGPQQNRVSMEKGLIDHWDPNGGEGSNLLWKKKELAGRSSPIVLRGKVYAIVREKPETATEQEMVVCADAATGEIIWKHPFNVYLSEVPADRVGWSSCVGDPQTGRIYAQGVCGYFCCLEGDTGKLVWDHSLHEELGTISTFGGRTNVPVIFEDNLLISAVVVGWGDEPKWGRLALPAHRFMCFNKATGELRWLNGTSISPYDTTYGTPTVLPVGGQQQLVFNSGDGGAWALQPRTGKPIWNFIFGRWGINVSPLVMSDGRVFTSHAGENTFGNTMGSVIALDGKMKGDLAGKDLWRDIEIRAGNSSPVMLGDRLYVVDDNAMLTVYDPKTGKEIGRKKLGRTIHSTPLVADGKIYLCTRSGDFFVLKPAEDGVEVVDKARLSGEENEGSLAVSHGRFYLTTLENMYCFGRSGGKSHADPLPAPPKESPITDKKIATIQVVPYDVVLAPGQKQKFHVRVFNALGQRLQPASGLAKISVDGPGEMHGPGNIAAGDALADVYQAPAENEHQCALVTYKIGAVTGNARVRIVPPLPWKFDFDKLKAVPLTWLGGRIRWELREDGKGGKYIAKRTVLPTPTNPNNKLGTRSYLWMGPISLSNYTIQADVLLKEIDGRMSDVGIFDSGYQLTIRSKNSKLRMDSWAASDTRTMTDAEFQPQPDTWYTMKLSVVPEKNQATVRGKIWQRGEKEPPNWTVQMVDHAPNLHGTPGVFGNAPDAEIYLDNLLVTPN
jgi:outer membrane protein assembly factor BamB